MISDNLVARYLELKGQAPGCLLLMQVGAFMKVLSAGASAEGFGLDTGRSENPRALRSLSGSSDR